MTTPQILVTQSSQATVQVSPADPAVVEILAPAVPVAVEVGVPGPQGPIGPVRLPNELRVDTSNAATIYVGRSTNGTAESSSAWIITRTTYNTAGVRTAKGVANNVTWTGRAGHTYV